MQLNELDSILFGLNALAYVLLFVWFWYQDRCFTLRTFITLLYAGSAIFAPYAYCAIDERFYNKVMIGHLTILPFCYLMMMYLMIFSPLLHSNLQRVTRFEILNPRLLNALTWVLSGVYLITIIFSKVELMDIFSLEQLMQNYIDTLNNTIDGFQVEVSTMERIASILKSATTDVVLLLLAYHIIQRHRWGILAMTVCLGYNIISSLSVGQRAVILEIIMSVIFIFLAIRFSMEEKPRRFLTIGLIGLGSFTLVAFGAITFARFADRDNTVMQYVMTYYSESWYIFNNHGLDPGGCRYGDFTAPLVRRAMGKPCTKTMFDSIDSFPTMRTNCSVFNTVVGDFTMDFGVLWTFVIFSLYAGLMHRELREADPESFPIQKLLLVILAWRIASLGYIAFSYRGIGGNLQIVTDLILYVILSRNYVLNPR